MKKRISATALALMASLAINGFLLAYVAVSWAGHWSQPLKATPHSVLSDLADRLPEADGAVLRSAIARHADKLGQSGGALQAHRARVGRLLAKPEVDPAELKALMEATRSERLAASEAMVSVMVEAMPKISHQTRLRIASFLNLE